MFIHPALLLTPFLVSSPLAIEIRGANEETIDLTSSDVELDMPGN